MIPYVFDSFRYLINMHACEVVDADKRLLAAVDYYFIQEDGKRFKVFVPFLPYFYIKCKSDEVIQETSAYLSKKFGGLIRGNLKLVIFNSKVLFSNFSCMFLNSNNFFHSEF